MTGYCRAGDMYVDWPCPAKACTSYKNCLEQYEILKQELNHEQWHNPIQNKTAAHFEEAKNNRDPVF